MYYTEADIENLLLEYEKLAEELKSVIEHIEREQEKCKYEK